MRRVNRGIILSAIVGLGVSIGCAGPAQPADPVIAQHEASVGTIVVLDADRRTVTIVTPMNGGPLSAGAVRKVPLSVAPTERATAVAVSPTEAVFFVAIAADSAVFPNTFGRLDVHDLVTGQKLHDVPTGVQPVAIAVEPRGRWAATADAGATGWWEGNIGEGVFHSSAGSVTIIDLTTGVLDAVSVTVALTRPFSLAGFVQPDMRRAAPTPMDLTRTGTISKGPIDLDGDGSTTGILRLGTFQGADVDFDERWGEATMRLPFGTHPPEILRPVAVAFDPQGDWLFAALGVNNAIAVIDVERRECFGYIGLGTAERRIRRHVGTDAAADELLDVRALCEPQSLAVTTNGRFIVTADTGATLPAAGAPRNAAGNNNNDDDDDDDDNGAASVIVGGARSVSVWDANTGRLIADTGDRFDARLAPLMVNEPPATWAERGAEPNRVVAFAWADLRGRADGPIRLATVDDWLVPNMASLADLAAPLPLRWRDRLSDRAQPSGRPLREFVAVTLAGGRAVALVEIAVGGHPIIHDVVRLRITAGRPIALAVALDPQTGEPQIIVGSAPHGALEIFRPLGTAPASDRE